jgi:DNA-binding NtrC family response regulator
VPERILLVEDRDALREALARRLRADAREVVTAATLAQAADALRDDGPFAVVVSDVRLPDGRGETLLPACVAVCTELVLMTAFAEVPAAVAALKGGAFDYLAKPFEPDDLARVVGRAVERHALVLRANRLEDALEAQTGGLLGSSAPMAAVRRLLDRVGPLPIPVLLLGESGTGKEVAARELHRLRGGGPFVAVNCGAIPDALLEAELFGAAKGAYSGSHADRRGLFEEAHGGTLFLDEIGELPLSLQAKLNRALEEGEIRRVGETRTRPIEVRLVAATHQDLDAMVAAGTFRADLYYRLKVVTARLPPLRDRREDIPLLAARFLQVAAARFGARARRLEPDALATLERADWPGNVRELRHALEHAAALCEGETVGVADLPEELRTRAPTARPGSWREAMDAALAHEGRAYLVELLRRTGGNVTQAATEADVERETLHRLLRRHGVDAGRFRG